MFSCIFVINGIFVMLENSRLFHQSNRKKAHALTKAIGKMNDFPQGHGVLDLFFTNYRLEHDRNSFLTQKAFFIVTVDLKMKK